MESLMDDICKPDLNVELPEEEHSFSVSWLDYIIDFNSEILSSVYCFNLYRTVVGNLIPHAMRLMARTKHQS